MAGDEDLEGQENDAQKIKSLMEKMESMTKTIEELRSNQPKVTYDYHSAIRMPAPKFEENMTVEEYQASVETWKEVGSVPADKQGAVLLAGLPVRGDKVGGLQRIVLDKVKDKLNTASGADEVLKAVKEVLCKPMYCRLIDWLDELLTARQKSGWLIEKWIAQHEGRMKKAKEYFDIEILPIMNTAILIRGVTSIEPNCLAAILKDQDLTKTGVDLVQDVKDTLKKFAIPSSSQSKAHGVKLTADLDIYGNPFKRRKFSSESEGLGTDDQADSVLFAKGGRKGERGKANKGYTARFGNAKRPRDEGEREKDRDRAKSMNLCFRCNSAEHRIQDCPIKKAELAEKKREVHARGEAWDRRDGTLELPTGEIVQKRAQGGPSTQYFVSAVSRQAPDEPELFGETNADPRDLFVFDNPLPAQLLQSEDPVLQQIAQTDPSENLDLSPATVDQYLLESDHEVLYAEDLGFKEVFLTDNSGNEAVMDTGCSKSCAGVEWTEKYLRELSPEDRADVKITASRAQFKFGDNKVYSSEGFVIAPIYLGGKRKLLSWDKVDTKIPLLISLKVMMRLGLVMKFQEKGPNVAEFDGTKVELAMRDGHIWVNVSPPAAELLPEDENRVLLAIADKQLDKDQLTKIHVQMAHPPKDKMKRILCRTKGWSEEIKETLEKVYQDCLSKDCRAREACQKVRKIGAKMPERVGELVCADLKIAGKGTDKDVLYIIDVFSNFVLADTITSKSPALIAEKFLELWVSRGLPRIKTLLTDCGTEFLGDDMAKFCEYLNIKHITTVPRTPQMNGQCERVHGIVDGNVERLRDNQPNISQRQALWWASYAWNTEERRHGYTAADLVYGPVERESAFVDLGPTELQTPDMSTKILDLLKSKELARIQHLQLKASNKVRDALYRKTIPTRERKELGTWVWMRRSLERDWQGPGQISDSLNSSCSVKIGNRYFSARHEDCLPLNEKEKEIAGIVENAQVETERPEYGQQVDIEIIQQMTTETRVNTDDINEQDRAAEDNDVQAQAEEPRDRPTDNVEQVGDQGGQQPEVAPVQAQPQHGAAPAQSGGVAGKRGRKAKRGVTFQSSLGLEEREVIQVNVKDKGWTDVSIIARHLPARHSEGEWYKLKFDPRNPRSTVLVDLKTIDWRKKDEVSQNLLVGDEVSKVFVVNIPQEQHNTERVSKAKRKELDTLKRFKTFEDVDVRHLTREQKSKIIPSTWNVVLKDVNNSESVKARLCARGDREAGSVRTDSPTVSRQSLRLLLSIAASKGFKIHSLDFTGAFLQGQPIDREVYLLPPQDIREARPNLIWKVIKRLYGFKDSSRGWFLEFDSCMKSLGCEAVNTDNAMYTYKRDGKIVGVAGVHVDDVLYAGEQVFQDQVIEKLLQKYVIGSVDSELFTFTGWTLEQDREGITLSQSHFLSQVEMQKFELLDKVKGDDKEIMNDQLQAQFRSLVGSLQWIVSISRPDKAYYAVALASRVGKATLGDARLGIKQLRQMILKPISIRFSALQGIEDCHIRTFCDSSWAKLDGYETVVALVTFLVDTNGKANVLDWQSNKLSIPAASPLTGEATAALDSYGKIVWLRDIVKDMTGQERIPAVIVTDSRSLQQAVDTTTTLKDKRAMVTVSTLRKVPIMEDISIKWCHGTSQLADVMTKPGARADRLKQVLTEGQLNSIERV